MTTNSHSLPLPALDGRSPLGFLAALGVLRLVAEHTRHHPRLSWSLDDATAVLHDAEADISELVADMVSVVQSIPPGGVLPFAPVDFPPPGAAPDKLRLSRPALREYTERLAAQGSDTWPVVQRWLASLVTDLALDNSGRADITQFAAPAGKQSMRTMLEKPLELVRAQPDLLREALTSWRRYSDVTGEYLDHRVLFDAAAAPNGRSAERGVPGATWLALQSYPMLRTTGLHGSSATTGWQDRGLPEGKRMVYPLWSTPLDVSAVCALLTHPVLETAQPGLAKGSITVLSVFWICHAQRRIIPNRKFAGVLTPVTTSPDARPPRRR